jgi:hypothetical protein
MEVLLENLKEFEDVDEIHLTQDMAQWQALVNTVLNLQIPQKRQGIS